MSTTQRQIMRDALVSRGWIQIPGRTAKYWTMRSPNGERFYFLGANGALRYGTSISKSVPHDKVKKVLLAPKVDLQPEDLGL